MLCVCKDSFQRFEREKNAHSIPSDPVLPFYCLFYLKNNADRNGGGGHEIFALFVDGN